MAATAMSGLSGKKMTRFMEDTVKPKGDDIDSMRKEVDKFVRFLHEKCSDPPFTVKRVVEGGSLGKGTAVRGNSDIDLGVVFNGISNIEELTNNREVLLNMIEKAAKKHNWRGGIKQTKRTKFSIQFKLNGHDVDVLPVYDALNQFATLAELYREMERYSGGPERAAQEYSASLSELQIRAVKGVDAKVKDTARMLKVWKKTTSEATKQIPSYSIELLTLHMSRRYGSLPIDGLYRKCMGKLGCCHDIRIAFDENYNSKRYTGRADAPYILDPANPLMNTLSGINHKEVTKAAQRYFSEFYKNNPEERCRGRSRGRSNGRAASRSRSKSKPRSGSRSRMGRRLLFQS